MQTIVQPQEPPPVLLADSCPKCEGFAVKDIIGTASEWVHFVRCVNCGWLKYLAMLCLVIAGCTTTNRLWSGRPAEEFPADKQTCSRAMSFDACMQAKGWRVQAMEGKR